MIGAQQLESLRNHTELLVGQVSLLEEKIRKSDQLESDNSRTPEEERARVMDTLENFKTQVPHILQIVEPATRTPPSPAERLRFLIKIDAILFGLKRGVETLAREHDECNLDLHKQEVVKAVELCREAFDWVIPQIRNELIFLEKFYGDPLHAQNTVMPEIETLLSGLENHDISIEEFLLGVEGKPGYRELRTRNGVYSPYQFYDHSFETYREINTCHYEICKAMESLLKEWKLESTFSHFLDRIRTQSRPIVKMGDIFEAAGFLTQFHQQTSRKFSFTEEMKRVKPLLQQFHLFRKKLVIYDQGSLADTLNKLDRKFRDSPDAKRYQLIKSRVQRGVQTQTLPFDQLESIFEKLEAGDFNIVVETGEDTGPGISITPHHEKVYGRDLLNRVNIILQEIDFWYPPNMKKGILSELSASTRDLQDDVLEDRNEFFKRMQGFDKEIEQKVRQSYNDRLREGQMILASFEKIFSDRQARAKFTDRLANQNIWNEITPRVELIKSELAAAHRLEGAKNNVNKFPHLRKALGEFNQMLYDLAMQLFVLFPGAEDQFVANMAGILSICKECHDLPTLWAAFSHYYKKIAIPNFQVNESMIMETSKNPLCKSRFKELSAF